MWGWGALEADFERYYRLNITEAVYSRQMTFRRFKVLCFNLPGESAFGHFIQDRSKWNIAVASEDNIDIK